MASSAWRDGLGRGSLRWMTLPTPFRGFRFLSKVIEHAVRLYHCFSLKLHEVKTILAARGVMVS